MKALIGTIVMLIAAGSVNAYPTKVKVLKDPEIKGSDMTLTTDKGTVTSSAKHRIRPELSKAKKGQCLILETETESTTEFDAKVDRSGTNTVEPTRC